MLNISKDFIFTVCRDGYFIEMQQSTVDRTRDRTQEEMTSSEPFKVKRASQKFKKALVIFFKQKFILL